MNIHESVYIAEGAHVLGDVTIGEDCGIWYNAVVRGDSDKVTIGARTNIQDCAVVHEDEGFPCKIGDDVTVGHGAIVHGCTVGNNVMIGMGAIIMNGAVIGDNATIGAGALVPSGKEIPANTIAFGNPAKVAKEATEASIANNQRSASHYAHKAKEAKAKQAK